MNFLKTTTLVGLLVGATAMVCASAQAAPLGGLARENVLAQSSDTTSSFILAQYKGGFADPGGAARMQQGAAPQQQQGAPQQQQRATQGQRAAPAARGNSRANNNYRGGNYRGGNYRGDGYRGGDQGAAVAAGVIGAIIGGAIAAQQQQNLQAGNDAIAYCMQRYRSFDPQSMTYMGFDGLRRPCP